MSPRLTLAGTLIAAALLVAITAVSPAHAREMALSPSAPLHRELFPEFEAFFGELSSLRQLDRRQIDAGLDVVLVRASTARRLSHDAPSEAQRRQQAMGVFVVERRTHRRRLTVDIFPAGPDWDIVVKFREIAADRLVLAIDGGSYDLVRDRLTYFWDLGARVVLERLRRQDVAIDSLLMRGTDLWAIGADNDRAIVVRITGAAGGVTPTQVEILTTIAGKTIAPIRRSRLEGDVLVLLGDTLRYRLAGDRWEVDTNPEPSAGRRNAADSAPFGLTVPVPDYATFARLRPRRVADGYNSDDIHLEAEISAFELVGRRLWFGTQFYDGEGTTGVGAFGYFDLDARTWRLFRPRAILDWSVSAILVERDVVWTGLVDYPEGRGSSGGLLRWTARTQAARTHAIPDKIAAIRRVGSRLYIGTENGLYVLDGKQLVHGRFRHERGGKLSLVVDPVGSPRR